MVTTVGKTFFAHGVLLMHKASSCSSAPKRRVKFTT